MTFQPVLPVKGYAGWAFLNRTLATQKEAFEKSSVLKREVEYFKNKIGAIRSADELVADRTLLKVALGAFGLEADISNKFFIKKILEGGTLNEKAIANRLSDKRYLNLSAAFGFGDFSTPRSNDSSFGEKITGQYKDLQFEVAVGEQDDDMRIALNVKRELGEIAGKDSTENTKWFTILGSPPLREVFETAFGLPKSFGALDLDQQLGTMKDKANTYFGAPDTSQFKDDNKQDALIRLFMLRSQIQEIFSSTSKGNVALSLLRNTTLKQ
jgi:hypothetical protein